MFKVNNKDSRTTPFVNFDHISHLVLVFLLLTLNVQLPAAKTYFAKEASEKNNVKHKSKSKL